ncbi:unnamed protein product [Haemonchus placei]|uniref:Uncharacterized protein n=1 Tax=Haemonchus placei TaxID=6290 RepID=A0A0N4W2S3_HAEPC|nr:unnamed protein product [Haemonchus placei]
MGQAASVESERWRAPQRARANTLKSRTPPATIHKGTRLSLPEYTLTQYDVKQLMKSFREAMEQGDTRTTSSAESEAEDELMDQIHGQFAPQCTRLMLQSTTSNTSEDSGIEENGNSPLLSLDDLPSLPSFLRSVSEDTPLGCTPETPMAIPILSFTPPAERIDLDEYIRPPQKRRRFIPKRLFRKKKIAKQQRSKSVGAYEDSRIKGLWFRVDPPNVPK